MSDVNVVISAVDNAMDMLEKYSEESHDIRAHVLFDLSSLNAAVDRKIEECRQRINQLEEASQDSDNSDGDDAYAYSSTVSIHQAELERLLSIKARCSSYGQDLADDIRRLFTQASNHVGDGLKEMGRYISRLNLINAPESVRMAGAAGSYVCVIDSSRYPQTAEHIETAIRMGFPSVLTLGRSEAAERRKASLQNVRTRAIYDRDEYPCAMFCEGGAGADVVYVEGRDNRGAGSFMRWQMRNMPDGSRVRIRVI